MKKGVSGLLVSVVSVLAGSVAVGPSGGGHDRGRGQRSAAVHFMASRKQINKAGKTQGQDSLLKSHPSDPPFFLNKVSSFSSFHLPVACSVRTSKG